eukprot:TRINITY_DN56132_c0_g1_i1.p1 TRINITY_DN56132_c0_g1~~TRINITY_DN56132_c0_g1_i1.p1  ORF type:complete len:340 (+),score=50.98 TRINITY_DN56132_c0_g1_i1:83-1102(+)
MAVGGCTPLPMAVSEESRPSAARLHQLCVHLGMEPHRAGQLLSTFQNMMNDTELVDNVRRHVREQQCPTTEIAQLEQGAGLPPDAAVAGRLLGAPPSAEDSIRRDLPARTPESSESGAGDWETPTAGGSAWAASRATTEGSAGAAAPGTASNLSWGFSDAESAPGNRINSADLAELEELASTRDWQGGAPLAGPAATAGWAPAHLDTGAAYVPTYVPTVAAPIQGGAAAAPISGPGALCSMLYDTLMRMFRGLAAELSVPAFCGEQCSCHQCLVPAATPLQQDDESQWEEKLVAAGLFLMLAWLYSDKIPGGQHCKNALRDSSVRLVATMLAAPASACE